MTERLPFLIIDAPEFVVHARPRLEGTDDRRPDVARTGFQSNLIRSFVNVPPEPLHFCAVTVDVPNDGSLPAAATLKSVIDALEPARVVDDDRHVVAARLRQYELVGSASPTVNVEVLPRDGGEVGFIRSTVQHDRRLVVRAVTGSVPYRDRSGAPGPATFVNRWATNPTEYQAVLGHQWQELTAAGAISFADPTAAFPLLGRLIVHLPDRYTEDADNALLYVVDMLELVRRDVLGEDAGVLTLDQLLVEVAFVRDLKSGVYVTLESVEPVDQYSVVPYYARTGERINPFEPESP